MRCIKGNKRDPDHINREDINREGFFCCGEIISQWVDFKNRFYEVGRNMLEAKLYDNEMDRNGTNTGRLQILSRQREREMEMNLKEIRVKDMVSRELEPLDLNSINRVIGFRLNFAEYFRLRNETYKLKNRMESRGQLNRKLETLFRNKTKGSKVLRMAIQNSECKEYHENDACNLPAVQRLAEAEDRGIDREVVEENMDL